MQKALQNLMEDVRTSWPQGIHTALCHRVYAMRFLLFFSQEIPTDMRCVKMMHCKDLRSRKEQREAAGMSFWVLSQQRETLWGKKRRLIMP